MKYMSHAPTLARTLRVAGEAHEHIYGGFSPGKHLAGALALNWADWLAKLGRLA